jgi:hypothetical protein
MNSAMAYKRAEFAFATYNAPPYQYVEDEVIKGVTVSTVRCIFHKLNKKISVGFFPLKRALRELDKNAIDGVFPVRPLSQSNKNISSPVSIEKWYWLTNFYLGDDAIIETLNSKLIGVINGSPAHEWLLEKKLTLAAVVTTRKQLLNMYIAGRVDAIIIDGSEVFQDFDFHRKIDSTDHFWRFIKFDSHHFAFSDEVVMKHPNLRTEFNSHISACSPISLKLSQHEKTELKNYLATYLSDLSEFIDSSPSIRKLEDNFEEPDFKNIDTQWVSEKNKLAGPLYDLIKNSKLSDFLADLQEKSQGAITEIIAIDTNGYTIALSKITTDLYQGDEAQFLNTYPGGANSIYIGDITYDESTQTFQSQVSFTLPTATSSLGVITFGVDVERIIQQGIDNVANISLK